MRRVFAVVIAGAACGGGSVAPRATATTAVATPVVAATPPPSPVREGEIDRSVLAGVLDGGLGRFLQRVETEPAVANGRFVGFRVTALSGGLERSALAAGDVVTRVNGHPIERPEQALAVWNGLRVASEIVVEYVRDDAVRELRVLVVD